ncbi:MAG: hypothetical protein ACI8X5_003822 [Planctomycetota bacterium]
MVSLAESAGLKDSESRIAAVETCSNRASMALKGGFLNEATGWLRLAGLAGDHSALLAADELAARKAAQDPEGAAREELGVWREQIERALTAE